MAAAGDPGFVAVEATDLRKTYPPDVTALDGVSLAVRGRHDLRAARAQRRRQVDHGQGPVHAHDARQRQRARWRVSTCAPTRSRVRHAIGVVGQKHGADLEATGRENLVLQGEFYGITGRDLKQRVDESLERFGLADAADRPGEDLLGRDAAAAGHRDGPAAPAAGAVPRRADHGPRPRGAVGDVARDRAARRRGADDDPADHPLPRGGRSARLEAGDHRPRPGRRAGNAQRAQERASRRHDPGRARRTPATPGARCAGPRRRPRRGRRSTAARCAPARATAARRSPRCSRRSRPTASRPWR